MIPIESHNRHIAKQMSGPGASGVVGRMDEVQRRNGQFGQFDALVDSQSQFVDSLDQPLVCKDYRLLLSPQNTKSASLLEKHFDLAGALSTQHNPT